MTLSLILEMAASALGDRVAVVTPTSRHTYQEVQELAVQAARRFDELEAPAVHYLGTSHIAFPVALFGAALAGIPLIPLNYRMADRQLTAMIDARPGAVLIADDVRSHWTTTGATFDRAAFVEQLADEAGTPREQPEADDPELPAVLLYTSGTTSAPKAAVLRHRHLTAYLFGAVEFAGADESEAALVAVPPYHVAGLANLLSNFYAGRRVAYLPDFSPRAWLDLARAERATNAMVVPSMLARIVDEVAGGDPDVPSLRTLSYGGARMPPPVIEQALRLFPDVGFVNVYGLTETSSTIAMLGPEDHRAAMATDDPAVRDRLGSVGHVLPGVEVEIRDDEGRPVPAGRTGLIHVRGEQVAGEYAGRTALDGDNWFATSDRAHMDEDGYLFIEGRADDTIIRGGENIAPAEIEDELYAHPAVADAVVVGVPDDAWGQRLVAVVVRGPGAAVDAAELQEWVRGRLRSSRTPDDVVFRDELPRTDTGKLIRRHLVADLVGTAATG